MKNNENGNGQISKTNFSGRNLINFIIRQGSAFLGLIVLMIVASFLSPVFLNPQNLLNILLQVSVVLMVSMGMTFVIISAGIDLSVGSIVAITAQTCALLALAGWSYWIAIPISLVLGFVMGGLNGFIIHKVKIEPFIVTLAGMQIYRGIALLMTGGTYLYNLPKGFGFLGQGHIFKVIPIPTVIAAGLFLVAWFILSNTKLGRNVYAIGGNEEAARLAGINVGLNKTLIYAICGLFCAIAAVVQTARLMSTFTGLGSGWELDAIASTVIGGTAFSGGIGGVTGTVIGALILGVIRNILTIINVNPLIQMIVIGLVVLLAVILDKVRQRMSYE